jgi:DNA polymerase I
MKHFVIIDGHHLMYRAYWAIPRHMRTSDGRQVNAVFGVGSMLLQILKTEEPDALLFVFDAGDKTFRHTEYAEYKEGRAETPDDFYEQIPLIQSMIATFGFATAADAGFEADDFAYAYAKVAANEGYRVTIVSGDRDLFQIVTDKIRVAIPHKGYQAAEYLGPAEVVAKFGVTPEQVPSYKGLVGDSSDNLKGVKGIGPKAAEALLKQYHTLEGIYEHLGEIKASWRTKLEADRESAMFCERMARLVCDMPLPIPFEDTHLGSMPTDPILHLFSELEFILLTKRLQSLIATPYGQRHFVPPTVAQVVTHSSASRPKTSRADDTDSTQLSLL